MHLIDPTKQQTCIFLRIISKVRAEPNKKNRQRKNSNLFYKVFKTHLPASSYAIEEKYLKIKVFGSDGPLQKIGMVFLVLEKYS